ncbi:MAG: hypothetical protein ACREO8_12505 [Luteimonas sp.]
MQRILLAVEFDESGWHVLMRGKRIDRYDSCAAAIDAAARFARTRHDATGEPTGVIAPTGFGETVMIETCG